MTGGGWFGLTLGLGGALIFQCIGPETRVDPVPYQADLDCFGAELTVFYWTE